jgi:hypothetical protein
VTCPQLSDTLQKQTQSEILFLTAENNPSKKSISVICTYSSIPDSESENGIQVTDRDVNDSEQMASKASHSVKKGNISTLSVYH